MRRAFLAIVLLFPFVPSAADAAAIHDLKINEVCPIHAQGIADSDPGAWIELINPLDSDISTAGIFVTDSYLNVLAELPMIILPPGGFLLIQLGEGVDDYDAADGRAVYNVGRATGLRLPWESGGIALFRGGVGQVETIRDFIAWGTRPLDGSAAQNLAVARGIWTSGSYVDLSAVRYASSFGLAVPGFDLDAESPWAFFSGRYDSGQPSPGGENLLTTFPRPGEVFLEEPLDGWLPAAWVATSFPAGGAEYLVEMRHAAEDGEWTVLHEELTPETSTDLPSSASGEYAWRVRPCHNGEPIGEASERRFYQARQVGERVELGLEYLEGLKDTEMLCLYDLGAVARPGCEETHWNVPHVSETANSHDAFYSARAAIAMINRYYGGDLSQDRISYEVFRSVYPGGEGDLGHGKGMRTLDLTTSLRWALGGINTEYAPWAPPFDHLRAELDGGRPVLITSTPGGNNREGAVIAGYAILTLYDTGPPMPAVQVFDPRSGAPYWVLYSFFAPSIGAHWQITGTPAGILQEASISIDSDGDGIVDFDEDPSFDRLHSVMDNPDTDGDGIADLAEVYCYTFHDWMNPNVDNDDPGFADLDGDGRRAENDVDSDGGGTEDGLEDLNRNGIAPEEGETDPYDPGDDPGVPPDPAAVEVEAPGRALRLARLAGDGSPGCRFRIDLPEADRVLVALHAIDGRRIAELLDAPLAAGSHEIAWSGTGGDGAAVPSGIYLVRMTTRDQGSLGGKLAYLR